ncbi:M56 family metallopeptidase [Nonlabens xiamenensis]|uniref:M56 family metallopeptidase n=1 Tax=Nonlabens xiamenensis TaxID=2341043 RepID=UPI000F612C96|nr:M56 family metallopeptidase [Nonlabens xiamenensis]
MELLEYLLKSAGVLSIFVLVYQLLLRKLTFFKANRLFLLFGLLASIFFPLIEITQTVYVEQPETLNIPGQWITPMAGVLEQPMPEPSIDFWELGLYFYLAVSIFFLGKIVVELSSLIKILRAGKKEKDGQFILVSLSRKLAPFSFFNFICFHESDLGTPGSDAILDHEKAHARQWHSIDLLLAHLYRALFWVNPLAWILKRQIGENLEFLADAKAKRENNQGMSYERTLLSAAAGHMQPALANNFFTPFIKKRIMMLQQEASARWNAYKYALILPVIVIFLYSFNVVEEIEYIAAAKTNSTYPTPTPTSVPEFVQDSDQSQNLPDHTSRKPTQAQSPLPYDQNNLRTLNLATTQTITFSIDAEDNEQYLKEKKEFLKDKYDVDFNYGRLKIVDGRIVRIKLTLDDNRGYRGSQSYSREKGIPDICVKGIISDSAKSWTMGKCGERLGNEAYVISTPAPKFPGFHISGDINMDLDSVIAMAREMETRYAGDSLQALVSRFPTKLLDSLSRSQMMIRFKDTEKDSLTILSLPIVKQRTLSTTHSPLFILNGEPMDSESVQSVSPQHIKSVSVLKDAKEIKMYGPEGANGVILIETHPDAEIKILGKISQKEREGMMKERRKAMEARHEVLVLRKDSLTRLKHQQMDQRNEVNRARQKAYVELSAVTADSIKNSHRFLAESFYRIKNGYPVSDMEKSFMTNNMTKAGLQRLAEKMQAKGHKMEIKTHRMSGDILRKLKIEIDGVEHTYVTEKGIASIRIIYPKDSEAPLITMVPNK